MIRNAVRQKDAISGVVSGLGMLVVEIVYLVFALLLGINLFRQGMYYQLFRKAGEERKISSQAANVIGTLLYTVLILILLPIVKAVSKRIFGG